jgi:hypothetical protein
LTKQEGEVGMKNLMKLKCVALLLGLVAFGLQTPTWAATSFDLVGFNFPVQILASVDFTYDSNLRKISVSLMNKSEFDARLTAFAFNVPDNVTGVNVFTGPANWSDSFSPNSINTPGQFGQFDLAGITGSNFNGGDPNDGIPPSSTFDFEFLLNGTGLDGLTEDSFLGLLSYPGNPNDNPQPFIARFQRVGSDGEGSDVAVVPIPAAAWLLGSGLVGLLALRRRFRH